MGKRSAFERRAGDAYPTPIEAVLPLIPHLRGVRNFAEPCAGDGALYAIRILRPVLHLCRRHRDRTGRACLRQLRRSSDHHQSALEARPATCVDRPFHASCTVLLGIVPRETGRTPANPETSSNTAPASQRATKARVSAATRVMGVAVPKTLTNALDGLVNSPRGRGF